MVSNSVLGRLPKRVAFADEHLSQALINQVLGTSSSEGSASMPRRRCISDGHDPRSRGCQISNTIVSWSDLSRPYSNPTFKTQICALLHSPRRHALAPSQMVSHATTVESTKSLNRSSSRPNRQKYHLDLPPLLLGELFASLGMLVSLHNLSTNVRSHLRWLSNLLANNL